ncbi:hypothetical protein H9639_07420 [Arthrobacter sp. Sa2CUA1]|uniref:Permease n=1 Tax=Arthrobacter gallicola TaxID=2762225 RepID=A0ABR8US95_9MICC|nr:hypothetical protein [Arthrobacter gallicola]MBD7995121.1 hypothetical protein [Arthrobacter gallicola]
MARVKLWSIAVPAAAALIGIVVASYISVEATAIVTGVAAALAGFGWPYLLGVPARKTQGGVLAFVGAGSVAAAYLAPATSMLTWLPAFTAVGVGAVFLIQLLRGTGQAHRLESTIGVIGGALISGMASGWVAADRLPAPEGSYGLITASGAAIFSAILVSLIPLPDRITAPFAVVAGAIAGGAAAALVPGLPVIAGGIIGAVCAGVIAAVRRLALTRDNAPGLLGVLSAGLAPVLALGTAVYFAGRLLIP